MGVSLIQERGLEVCLDENSNHKAGFGREEQIFKHYSHYACPVVDSKRQVGYYGSAIRNFLDLLTHICEKCPSAL